MKSAFPLVKKPIMKPGCVARLSEGNAVLIENGWRGLVVPCTELPSEVLVRILQGDCSSLPGELLAALVRGGVIIDSDLDNTKFISAEYVAFRLLDRFKDEASPTWNTSSIFHAMMKPGHQCIAIGFLLESYFHIRAANWTAAPVLSGSLTTLQRSLLEQFFVDERGHGEHIYECFSEFGLIPAEVHDALASTETELFERFMYSCASKSATIFAAALIIPEIPELSGDNKSQDGVGNSDLMTLLQEVQEIPLSVCSRFRSHDQDNANLGHESLPIQIISERVAMSRDEMDELFVTMRYAIHAYKGMLDGVVRRYAGINDVKNLLSLKRQFPC
jgi:hypothetical protein